MEVRAYRHATAAALLVALAGCDSDDDGEPSGNETGGPNVISSAIDPDGATLLGLTDIAILDDVESGKAVGVDAIFAIFRRFASGEDLGTFLSLIRPAAPDTCTLREREDALSGSAISIYDAAESIDAGEVLVITSPAGTWAELTRSDGEDGLEYVEPGNAEGSIVLPDSVPAGLVLDVPGADFPAFTAVPVPAVTPLGEIAPARFPSRGAAVTDTFSWTSAEDSLSVVRFDFLIAVGEVADDGFQDVACVARDDGAFAIPAATLETIGADEGTDFVVMVTRETLHVERQGNALLLTSQSSEGL